MNITEWKDFTRLTHAHTLITDANTLLTVANIC